MWWWGHVLTRISWSGEVWSGSTGGLAEQDAGGRVGTHVAVGLTWSLPTKAVLALMAVLS